MDAGLAAIVGAGVGAVASLGATALGAIPGLNPEDRSQRIARRLRLEALLTGFTSDLMALALASDDAEGKQAQIDLRAKMLVTRVELASLVPRRGKPLIDLYDVAMMAAQRSDGEFRTRAGALFSLGASLWLSGSTFTDEVRNGMKDLRTEAEAPVVAPAPKREQGEAEYR